MIHIDSYWPLVTSKQLHLSRWFLIAGGHLEPRLLLVGPGFLPSLDLRKHATAVHPPWLRCLGHISQTRRGSHNIMRNVSMKTIRISRDWKFEPWRWDFELLVSRLHHIFLRGTKRCQASENKVSSHSSWEELQAVALAAEIMKQTAWKGCSFTHCPGYIHFSHLLPQPYIGRKCLALPIYRLISLPTRQTS